ncbi:hypothetical protein IJL65_01145 [bacterium]|nr:hypothetical protein [bacterium]
MDSLVGEEKAESPTDDQMDEMDEIEGPLFFRQAKMKARCWIINTRKYLKQRTEKTEGQKINTELMHLI